ncbi:hypothetical protein TWF730_001843 [Orbilia blumenaviensis]|uniref:Uncharacterized protein n=1 Tax=Orbilia blumenaviensis TaxID=1796055 RepID=A0AAV9UC69_9PEZI
MRKNLELVVESRPGHEKEIRKYIRERVRLQVRWIEDKIRSKAEGVFMSIFLVIKILNWAFDGGNVATVEEKPRKIPNGPHQVLSELLEKIIHIRKKLSYSFKLR